MPTQRVSFLYYFEISILMTGPKIFLKAPLAPIYSIFEGGARRKNANFRSKLFQKLPKNAFLACFFFFKVSPMAKKIGPNQGLFSTLGEFGKSI